MLVMTARVDKKKAALIISAVIVAVAAIILLFRGRESTPTVSGSSVSSNDGRVAFLKSFGWEVTTSPTESSQVRIPSESTDVYDRYNALQKSQGYDLTAYAGKTVMRYVYRINNYPGATEPVYATLLVYKNQIIGGDITDTAAKGVIQGFKMPVRQELSGEATAPAETQSPGSTPTE